MEQSYKDCTTLEESQTSQGSQDRQGIAERTEEQQQPAPQTTGKNQTSRQQAKGAAAKDSVVAGSENLQNRSEQQHESAGDKFESLLEVLNSSDPYKDVLSPRSAYVRRKRQEESAQQNKEEEDQNKAPQQALSLHSKEKNMESTSRPSTPARDINKILTYKTGQQSLVPTPPPAPSKNYTCGRKIYQGKAKAYIPTPPPMNEWQTYTSRKKGRKKNNTLNDFSLTGKDATIAEMEECAFKDGEVSGYKWS